MTGAVAPEGLAKASSDGSEPAPVPGGTTWTLSAKVAISPRAARP